MRKPRILKDGVAYHVSAKINRGERIFEDDQIKNLFLEVLKDAQKKYSFIINNFVIMDNHIHCIIKPLKRSSLSRIMQWILSRFAVLYNFIFKLSGHVWQGRFWSKIVDDIKQLIDTFNYISDNPVKAGIAKNAEDYKFGGLYHILKGIYNIVEHLDFEQFMEYN